MKIVVSEAVTGVGFAYLKWGEKGKIHYAVKNYDY
jgi:hypothetical protein